MRGAVRFGVLTFIGVLLLQAAWMLAVPPFRGADEFDHAYRAAGVASGQWRLTESADNGRGHEVKVPVDLVTAAHEQCSALAYTGPDNCRPFTYDGDQGMVATGAGAYPPVYYWILGTAGERLDGSRALYAMRVSSALLCAVGLALAGALLALTGDVWTKLAFLASLTPVFVYSTVVAAPNGPEIVAGACMWAGLLAFGGDRRCRRMETLAVGLTTSSVVVLANLRLLGPVLALLIFAVAATYIGPTRLWRRCLEHRLVTALALAVALLSGVAGMAWTLTADSLRPLNQGGASGELQFVPSDAFQKIHLWLLQIVGAFPYPNQPGPIVIYPLVLVVVTGLLALAMRNASPRPATAIVVALVIVLVGPSLITLLTMNSQGVIWQGRYGLPFVVGILPMAGLILDRAAVRARPGWLILLALGMLGLAQLLSVVHVLRAEFKRDVSVLDDSWVYLPTWAICTLVAVGWTALCVNVLSGVRVEEQ